MPALNQYHNIVRNALIKDGWTITHDPLTLKVGADRVHIDLGAERVLAAERGDDAMAAITQTADMIEQTLCAVAQEYDVPGRIRTLLAFDREHGQFLLLDEGWEGHRRVHQVWLHVELRDNIIYIHEDGTEEGIANRFMAAGQPRDAIVLAFQAPSLRAATGFAVA